MMLSRMGMTSIIISFSFFVRKNTTMNNTITIGDVHGSQTRTNIDVMNEINHIKPYKILQVLIIMTIRIIYCLSNFLVLWNLMTKLPITSFSNECCW